MNIEGPPPPAPQPQQGRLQNLIDGLVAGLDARTIIKMLVVVVLLVGTIVGVATMHKKHSHPQVALWCKPNATVSLDGGRGVFSSISDAVEAAPSFSNNRYCIHIKGGRYKENIVIGSDKTNLILLGDGVDQTVIAANQTCPDQNCELQATLSVKGSGFIAIDLTVENDEDPVALATAAVENWADKSVFYRCRLRSRHEAIRAYILRQFYRDCTIVGSGSIIYGEGPAFFQNCSIVIDGSVKNVTYTVAEHSPTYQSFSGGFVFHLCEISADGDPTVAPLLGLAVTPYARIAYLECFVNLQVGGWSTNGYPAGSSIFFAEYGNSGVGSSYNHSWQAVHMLDFSSASQLSLGHFFADDWVPMDIPHKLDLGR